jgi:hypothetical protein
LSNGRWMRRIYNSTQGNDPVNWAKWGGGFHTMQPHDRWCLKC